MTYIAKGSFYLLIICFVLIPSSILLPIKLLCIFGAVAFWVLAFLLGNKQVSREEIFFVFLFVAWLLFSAFYAMGDQEYSDKIILRAFISYLSLFLLFLILASYVRFGYLSVADIKRAFCACLSLYCITKLVVIFLPAFLGVPASVVAGFFDTGFLVEYRSSEQQFLRIATSNDLMIPFALTFLIFGEVFKSKIVLAVIISLLLATSVLTFTRYVWLATVVPLLFFVATSNLRVRLFSISLFLVSLFYISLMFGSSSGESGVAREVTVRAFDSASIGVKEAQSQKLLDLYSESPFWGFGIGSYDKNYIRSSDFPFIYETQWVSILVQAGILGSTIILFYVFFPIFAHLYGKGYRYTKECFCFCLVYFLFLLSGITNPNITLLNSAFIYFLAYAVLVHRERKVVYG